MLVIVEKLRDISVRRLTEMLAEVLSKAEKGVVDEIGGFLSMSHNRDEILNAFSQGVFNHFEALLDREIKKPEPVYDFETLSLVQDDDLEIMVALEGMINAARNAQLATFISFNTRLNAIIENKRVDESTNPLDPSQVAEAFKDAIQPLNMDAQNSLSVFRLFNRDVLLQLEGLLQEGNQLLIESGVLPDLRMDGGRTSRAQRNAARSPSRPHQPDETAGFGTVEETPYKQEEARPELFSMMQNLLHPGQNEADASAPSGDGKYAVPASLAAQLKPADGEGVRMVDQAQLMEILTNLQRKLDSQAPERPATDEADVNRVDITSELGEMLGGDKAGAVDRQSADIINLVTMLYEAIWRDDSVPIPIKELIGRTQVTIIKLALSDTTFFDDDNHPARTVLNEFAEAGIGWTEVEHLEDDPLYKKIQELVKKILTEYQGQDGFFDGIVKSFRSFRAKEFAKTRVLEQRILRAKERKERLDDIHELVRQKIDERVLGRELPPFIEEMLEGPFHKFMVMLVLKEGPGTNAWKQAINTIDVLLWTVQPHDLASDRERLGTVNPRLLNNLRKAFRIAQLDPDEIERTIKGLQEVQDASFEAEAEPAPAVETIEESEGLNLDRDQSAANAKEKVHAKAAKTEETELSADDPNLKQVDQISVGVWVEFAGDDEDTAIRCKLAAKINAIDKYIFVNRQGVKVVEKTRMGLARELKDGTVRFISDGPLFSRALESVIGNLRESQKEQQTGGAYRPEENTA